MEWDDCLRQQAAMYRQLAEKAEGAVVKQGVGRRLRRGGQQHRGSSYKRVNDILLSAVRFCPDWQCQFTRVLSRDSLGTSRW